MHTCSVTKSNPLVLFRQQWELWLWIASGGSFPPRKLPADLNPVEGTLLLISASPVNTGRRLKMSRARQLGPSAYRARGISQRCPWELQTPSHCTGWCRVTACCLVPGARFLPLYFPPLLEHRLLLRKLGCREHLNQKHREGTVPACSCLASQREDWIPCIWQSRGGQSLYWQN